MGERKNAGRRMPLHYWESLPSNNAGLYITKTSKKRRRQMPDEFVKDTCDVWISVKGQVPFRGGCRMSGGSICCFINISVSVALFVTWIDTALWFFYFLIWLLSTFCFLGQYLSEMHLPFYTEQWQGLFCVKKIWLENFEKECVLKKSF